MPLLRMLGAGVGLPGTVAGTVVRTVAGTVTHTVTHTVTGAVAHAVAGPKTGNATGTKTGNTAGTGTKAGTRTGRRVHRAAGRTHIPVRGVHRPGTEDMARALCRELLDVDGVLHAEVNAVLGLVMVLHGDEVPVDALIELVEAVERRHGADEEPFADHVHPADGQAILREAVLMGVHLVGGGAAIVGRVLPGVGLPPGIATLAAMAEASPPVRDRLERRIGRGLTDLVFGAGLSGLQALTQQPFAPLMSSAQRFLRLGEMRAHRDAWDRRAEHAMPNADAFHAEPIERPPRPVPLPYGPVERAYWSIPAAISAAVGVYALTRDAGRAQGVLAAGVPRAARLGREAFANRLGRTAAARDVVVLDPETLRRFDRVDRVIVDASALCTGARMIDEISPLSETVAAERAYERARALIDLRRPRARHADGPWAVAPLDGSAARARPLRDLPDARALADAWRARGATVLMLTRRGRPAALVSVVTELDPLAEALLAAARSVGPVTVAGVGTALRRRIAADHTVPGGKRLLASVRRMQQEGHTVALVAGHEGAALAAADVGIGVLGRADAPPWGAHLLCGPGLAEACLLIEALGPARKTSVRSARIAGVGSLAGALLAAAGPAAGSARRAQLAVDLAALVAFAAGTWSGAAVGRKPLAVPVNRTPWHSWPAQAVLDRLDSSLAGLAEEEAERRRAARRAEDGEPAPPGLAEVTVEELDNPLTPALVAGAGVSAVLGSIMDAVLIGAVLGVNAVLSGVQRVNADRAVKQLLDLTTARVRLRRPGERGEKGEKGEKGIEVDVTADELVPGDVVALAAGDAVPADCRLLAAEGLEVDESSLTGESQLVAKTARPSASPAVAERTSMLYQGTVVAAGNAVGVVVATGAQTEVGRTTRYAGEPPRPGGVESRMRALTKVTLPIAIAAGALLLASDLMRGRSLAQALGPGISLAVAAVPEGLPFVATAAELATARRLSRRGSLVRDPTTIEALGRVDVLCFDKTGTLTEGRLRLRQVSDGVSGVPVTDLSPLHREIVAAALRASPEQNRRLAHPTDRAVARTVRKLGMSVAEGLDFWTRVDELPFEPGRGYHAVLGQTGHGQRLSVKGAPEIVLDRCRTWRRETGTVQFDRRARETVDREIDRLARLGYRVLAVAERPASGRRDLTESRIDRLTFLGLLSIADPVRPTAAEAVARLRTAGVDVLMITGDHPTTAEAIAAELDLLNGRIMTGPDLDALPDDALTDALAGVSVFARMSPEQKARVVKALRAAGRVVAVTGDGANDVPAIRLADVGIALGERATSAARETADVVITDDRIETITEAIAACRAMWRSMRDALAVLLGGNLGEIVFTLGAGLLTGRSPLGVRQILLVNLLTDMLPAIALAVRRPTGVTQEELLAEGPERSLGTALTRDITARAAATAGAALAAWLLGRVSGTRGQADMAGLVALVATQLAQTIAAGGRDPLVLVSGLTSLAALGTIVQVPGLSHFFGCRPLLPHCWAIALGCAGGCALAAVLFTRLTGRGRGEVQAMDQALDQDGEHDGDVTESSPRRHQPSSAPKRTEMHNLRGSMSPTL